jgi:uncharacterized protein involved in response to NO
VSAPFWQLGFRPFFALGALAAVVLVSLWLALQAGVPVPTGRLGPIVWHAHEMVFGFAVAIVAGFVLTASQSWSGLRGVHGRRLQLLVVVWLLPRVLLLTPAPLPVVAAVDLAFLPLVGAFLWPYLKDPELKPERVLFVLFAVLTAGNAMVYAEALDLTSGTALRGVRLGLHALVLMIVFIGGRVIPFFTESSIAPRQPRTRAWVEAASHGAAWTFVLAQLVAPTSPISAGIALVAGLANLVRLAGWWVRRVRRVPLLWVLHASYLWLVVGFVLSGLASLGVVATTYAVHAFTVGGIGAVIHGMISRVSLGHTGRRLHPSAWTVVGFAAIHLAAVVRVVVPLVRPALQPEAVQLSGALWVTAFGLFLLVYVPMLLAPRTDGEPG